MEYMYLMETNRNQADLHIDLRLAKTTRKGEISTYAAGDNFSLCSRCPSGVYLQTTHSPGGTASANISPSKVLPNHGEMKYGPEALDRMPLLFESHSRLYCSV